MRPRLHGGQGWRKGDQYPEGGFLQSTFFFIPYPPGADGKTALFFSDKLPGFANPWQEVSFTTRNPNKIRGCQTDH